MSCTCTEGCPACLMADDRMPAGRRPLCCMSCGALEGLAGHGAGCPDAGRSAAESYKQWAERQGREVAAERAAVTDTTVRDPLPAIGDYVRWENSVTGHWLEGRLVRWTKSIEGQPLARILVEQGVSPFAPGYVTGVGVGPMGLLRKVGRPGDSVSADAPRIHINPLPPMTPERADQIIAEFERRGSAGFRNSVQRQCHHSVYPAAMTAGSAAGTSTTFAAAPVEYKMEILWAEDGAPSDRRPDGFIQSAVDAAKAVLLSVGTRKGKP